MLIESRLLAGILDMMTVISFGRVAWMVEKSGIEMTNALVGPC